MQVQDWSKVFNKKLKSIKKPTKDEIIKSLEEELIKQYEIIKKIRKLLK